MKFKSNQTPSQDTGWGLIFRLNDLFREVEDFSPKGKYDEWNFKLDRIWANLSYRNDFNIVIGKNGKIAEIKLCEEDIQEKEYFDMLISNAKKDMKLAKKDSEGGMVSVKEYSIAKSKLYKALLIKDIWVRKLMHKNKLYIKEISSNPAGAMWNR